MFWCRYTMGKSDRWYYSLTWTVTFAHDRDTVYFAHCYPYTYSDLQDYLNDIQNDPIKSKFCRQRLLCRSLASNCIQLLTITSPFKNAEEAKVKYRSTTHSFSVVICRRTYCACCFVAPEGSCVDGARTSGWDECQLDDERFPRLLDRWLCRCKSKHSCSWLPRFLLATHFPLATNLVLFCFFCAASSRYVCVQSDSHAQPWRCDRGQLSLFSHRSRSQPKLQVTPQRLLPCSVAHQTDDQEVCHLSAIFVVTHAPVDDVIVCFRVQEERDVVMYCDLHGHSRKQNVFIYGCENRGNPQKRLRERIFPVMLSRNAPDKVSSCVLITN